MKVEFSEQKFVECERIYKRLVRDHTDDSDGERLANLLAVQVRLGVVLHFENILSLRRKWRTPDKQWNHL